MIAAPSLHEIAAMPFPQSLNAMREHYNPNWGKPLPEDYDGARHFKVVLEYEVTRNETESLTVEAHSAEEALERATQACRDDCTGDDFDVVWSKVTELEIDPDAKIDVPLEQSA